MRCKIELEVNDELTPSTGPARSSKPSSSYSQPVEDRDASTSLHAPVSGSDKNKAG